MPVELQSKHVQLETTSHRKPGRVRYLVGLLLVHDEAFIRYLTFGGRRVPRLEQQIAEVVFRRAVGRHAQRDGSVSADGLLNSALHALLRYGHAELKETISYVDAVRELLEGDRRVEQLPLKIVRKVRRYEMIRVGNEEELVDRMYRLALVFLSTTAITSCRRAAATICPRPGLQVVTRYVMYAYG